MLVHLILITVILIVVGMEILIQVKNVMMETLVEEMDVMAHVKLNMDGNVMENQVLVGEAAEMEP